MEYIYIAVTSDDRPGWADSFLLPRDRDPDEAVREKYPETNHVKIQTCKPTRIRS